MSNWSQWIVDLVHPDATHLQKVPGLVQMVAPPSQKELRRTVVGLIFRPMEMATPHPGLCPAIQFVCGSGPDERGNYPVASWARWRWAAVAWRLGLLVIIPLLAAGAAM